jgi:processive rubber oxygenase RoxA-like protein
MSGNGSHRMLRSALALSVFMSVLALAEARAQQGGMGTTAAAVTYAAQGWSPADRNTFYTTSQGSRMMPYAWFKALRRLDADQPFAADKLQRYGYLPNDPSSVSNPEGLPVGFVIDGAAASGYLGMTCAACHTGQLEYRQDGVTRALRLDGAPANVDFQEFLTDLLAASRATLAQPDRFDTFAREALGGGYTGAKATQVKEEFGKWVAQFGEFMDKSLPASPWGPGRLDAFGMIFNRVVARDLGVVANFKTADAPVSYPFLWNASRQDRTQWNGGVPNGLYIHALGRNTGEVFGVFADFAPRRLLPPTPLKPAVIDYKSNSVKFDGLQTLEEKIAALRPPPWPRDLFGLDESLAARGKPLFEAHCSSCHAVQASVDVPGAWRTPVLPVGTDPKMVLNSTRMSDAGLLDGALMPPPAIGARIGNPAKAGDLLANTVVGTLLAEAVLSPPGQMARSGVFRALRKDFAENLPGEHFDTLLDPKLSVAAKREAMIKIRAFITARLSNMFNPPPAVAGAAYESRVLNGIWATAPYLHNGSVPNLWELLKPAKERRTTFMVGSRVFDPRNVGYDADQSPFRNGRFVAEPANGNGNGGHEYGTKLTEDERWAIIEYLKTL